MPAKVKGFFKGLRYIHHIFENPKEPELQIGLPTDVKHVAHIGWDGPSTYTPSWMSEFDSTELTLPPLHPIGESKKPSTKLRSEERTPTRVSLLLNNKETENSPRGPLSTGYGLPLGSPPKRSARKHHLRRNRAPTNAFPDSSVTQESPRVTSKHSRQHKKSADASSNEPTSASKQSCRKRSPTTSKSKARDSFDEAITTDSGLSLISGHEQENNKNERREIEVEEVKKEADDVNYKEKNIGCFSVYGNDSMSFSKSSEVSRHSIASVCQ